MAIELNILQKTNPKASPDNPRPQERVGEDFLFRDVRLDLEKGKLLTKNDSGIKDSRDIASNDDVSAIVQSVKNILNTSPGEKLLNPYLGLDLKHFLFSPITKQTADSIARAIYSGLGQQEPRIDITKVSVIGDADQDSYEVTIAIQIPTLNNRRGSITGNLGADGFKFKN